MIMYSANKISTNYGASFSTVTGSYLSYNSGSVKISQDGSTILGTTYGTNGISFSHDYEASWTRVSNTYDTPDCSLTADGQIMWVYSREYPAPLYG